MDSLTESLLLVQDGDNDAFGSVVRLSREDVRRFCRWFGAHENDLDDIVQDIYLRVFRGVAGFRGESSAMSWILTIARRAMLDHARSSRTVPLVDDGRAELLSVSHPTEAEIDVILLLGSAPLEFREAFILVRIMGFPYDEAARIIGCPVGTVQSRVHRARRWLADQLMPPASDTLTA